MRVVYLEHYSVEMTELRLAASKASWLDLHWVEWTEYRWDELMACHWVDLPVLSWAGCLEMLTVA